MSTEQATAPFIQSHEAAGESWLFGGRASIRSTGGNSGGALGLVELKGEPGFGSPLHIHHHEDAEYYVIDGQVRFFCEDRQWVAGPGTFAFLPRDLPQGFEVIGDTPARFLLMATPAGFEGFMDELSEPEPGPPDMARAMSTASRYGLEILGPLPAAAAS